MSLDSPVLLVDSSPTLLMLERTLLARRGWKIQAASTVAEARGRLASTTPGLVLSADHLPDGSGLDLCREVRSDPRTKNVPFLFVVGRRDPELMKACRDAGGNELLYKPLRGTDVDRTVNLILGLEVRRWERRIFHTLVAITAIDGREGGARHVAAVNITPEGIQVEYETAEVHMTTGSKVRLLFYVPNHHEPITGEALVVWERPQEGLRRAGLKFLRLVPGGIQRIAVWGGFSLLPGKPGGE